MKLLRAFILAAFAACLSVAPAGAQVISSTPPIALATLTSFGACTPCTAAQNDAAIARALTSGKPIFVPAGVYQISAAIDARVPGLYFRGAGKGLVSFKQMTANTPIMKLGGSDQNIGGFQLEFAATPSGSDTLASGIDFYKFDNSTLSAVTIYNSFNAINIPQVDVGAGGNWEYQNNISEIDILDFVRSGLSLVNYNAASTGSHWSNVRIQSLLSVSPTGTADSVLPVELQNYDDGVFSMFNIEWTNPSDKLGFIANSNLVFDSFHIEQYRPNYWEQPGITISGTSRISIRDLTMVYSNYQVPSFLFDVAAGSNLTIDGFSDSNMTYGTDGHLVLFRAADASSSITLSNFRPGSRAIISSRTGLRQYNDYLFDAGQMVKGLAGAAAPAGGMPAPFRAYYDVALGWVVGDYSKITTPTSIGPFGYVNTVAGSPGTWSAQSYIGAPQNIQDANYSIALSDSGKQIYHTSASAHTWTIPANASVAFPIGTVIVLANENGGGNVTIAITSDTLRWGASTGSRTLSANGTASIMKVSATVWRITGDSIS